MEETDPFHSPMRSTSNSPVKFNPTLMYSVINENAAKRDIVNILRDKKLTFIKSIKTPLNYYVHVETEDKDPMYIRADSVKYDCSHRPLYIFKQKQEKLSPVNLTIPNEIEDSLIECKNGICIVENDNDSIDISEFRRNDEEVFSNLRKYYPIVSMDYVLDNENDRTVPKLLENNIKNITDDLLNKLSHTQNLINDFTAAFQDLKKEITSTASQLTTTIHKLNTFKEEFVQAKILTETDQTKYKDLKRNLHMRYSLFYSLIEMKNNNLDYLDEQLKYYTDNFDTFRTYITENYNHLNKYL